MSLPSEANPCAICLVEMPALKPGDICCFCVEKEIQSEPMALPALFWEYADEEERN